MIIWEPEVCQISFQQMEMTVVSPPVFQNINDMVFGRLKNPLCPIQQLHLHGHKNMQVCNNKLFIW